MIWCFCYMLIGLSCYSGEKTSTKEWPSFLEIKGRVRLDDFENFIHSLPTSRSRAIMVYIVFFLSIEILSQFSCSIYPSLLLIPGIRVSPTLLNDICYPPKRMCLCVLCEELPRKSTVIFLLMNHSLTDQEIKLSTCFFSLPLEEVLWQSLGYSPLAIRMENMCLDWLRNALAGMLLPFLLVLGEKFVTRLF